ncbi:MAG: AAA family ATPase, partial [Erysipelotrichaceae bacterium]|nr:AAA family ATPase [Erysipelotrichaceae bacterium]
MLQKLYIKDFILIEEVDLDFNNGFSVFTGETGAGKSIFIDCVSILIGERMNISMIRNGTDKAIIQGTFDLTESVREKLVANGYRDDQLVINREISVDGKSVTKLNGKNATVSFLRDLMKDYVDIHCQHDNQYLLNDKYHLDLLDSYSKDAADLQELKGLYTDYHKLEKEYDDLLKNEYNEACPHP